MELGLPTYLLLWKQLPIPAEPGSDWHCESDVVMNIFSNKYALPLPQRIYLKSLSLH